MISIICPCFNSGDTIDGVINSLLTQVNTKFKYEVIFIDDGSKDNTISLIKNGIKQLDSKGITSKIHLGTHKGPGAARNQGINISNYDYIAFIDSDDIWENVKLEKQISFMEKNNLYFTYSDYMPFFQTDKNKIYKKKTNLRNTFDFNAFIKNSSIRNSNFFRNFI